MLAFHPSYSFPPRVLRRLATLAIAALFTLVTTQALATEDPAPPPTLRIGGALTAGYAFMHRSASSPAAEREGLALGAEVHVHPYSQHGFFAAATSAGALFGPEVDILDAGYSWRFLGSSRLRGLTGAGYFDVGPAFAFVRNATPAPTHDVFGGRASVAFDAQLYNVTLGVVVGYRGGVPLGGARDGWEGAFTSMLRVGVVFDVGTATSK